MNSFTHALVFSNSLFLIVNPGMMPDPLLVHLLFRPPSLIGSPSPSLSSVPSQCPNSSLALGCLCILCPIFLHAILSQPKLTATRHSSFRKDLISFNSASGCSAMNSFNRSSCSDVILRGAPRGLPLPGRTTSPVFL